MVLYIAQAFAARLTRKLDTRVDKLRISVGTDSRLSSLMMRCVAGGCAAALLRVTTGGCARSHATFSHTFCSIWAKRSTCWSHAHLSRHATCMASLQARVVSTGDTIAQCGMATTLATWLACTIQRQQMQQGTHLLCRTSFQAGIASAGATVADCSMATTPAMFFSCISEETSYDGGVMATASHLPFNRNGLKFFTKDGGARAAACASASFARFVIGMAKTLPGCHRSASTYASSTKRITNICAVCQAACPSAGLNKADIRWILEEAASRCHAAGHAPADPRFDPGAVVAAALAAPPAAVERSDFMRAYAASLSKAIIEGVEVRHEWLMPIVT
jgi:Phosphoglucomutase/phosphomannomutase, alpha/beta/alpha domain I